MKTTLYYDLIEALSGEKCPVCSLLFSRVNNNMDYFLYEQVNNGRLRERIRNDRGFCRRHASMLLSMGDPLSHAQIYSDLLSDVLKMFGNIGPGEKNAGRSSCLFCEEEERYENDICDSFASSMSEEEFTEKFRSNGYLCLDHYKKILSSCDKLHLSFDKRRITEIEKEKIEKIKEGLEEIKLKHDYRNTGESISAFGKTSWRKAVNIISGMEAGEFKIKKK